MTNIGVDLPIFELLTDNDGPLTVSQIADRVAAAPELLSRYQIKILLGGNRTPIDPHKV